MKLLFLHGEARIHIDREGTYYTSGTYNEHIWDRYLKLCDELTVITRLDETIYDKAEALRMFNPVPKGVKCVPQVDIYKPKKNYFSKRKRRHIQQCIKDEVLLADRVIIRSLCDYYSDLAIKWCRAYKRKYLVEVISFEFEQLWYHSIFGKMIAPFNEIKYRLLMRNVEFAVYVTKDLLQRRYPSRGKMLGCSDVIIEGDSKDVLHGRKKRINTQDNITLGTAASLDLRYKKQEDVIKALAQLKRAGYMNIEYHLVGNGTGHRIMRMAKRYQVEDRVKILGELPHDEVVHWLDEIDIYIQPSYLEGVSRAVIEAMSRACPVICADAGGNKELVPEEYMYNKADIKKLSLRIIEMMDKERQIEAATRNYYCSGEYIREKLDPIREAFYRECIYG